MEFPAEIIEIIAGYLSSKDQYQGLTVCRDWYSPFCRSFYRHIEFKNRQQLKRWFHCQHKSLVRTIQFGSFEKHQPLQQQQQNSADRVTGAIPLYPIHVGVTSTELAMVFNQLPLLESVQFDSRLWQYLDIQQLQKLAHHRLVTLPALDHPRQLSFIQSKRGLLMTSLQLRGSDMFQLHKKGLFLNIFQSTPNLNELIIDSDVHGDFKHAMPFSIQDMETLHSSLPNLNKLDVIDSVRFIESSSPMDDYEQLSRTTTPSQLNILNLSVLIEKHAVSQWLSYFSYKYSQLTELTLMLSSPYQIPRQPVALEHSERSALAFFLNKLVRLQKLAIDHSMSKLYLNDTTMSSTNPHLSQLQLGLWGNDAESTSKALEYVTMNPTTINSISHLCIPLWSSEKSIDFSVLSRLRQLTHLELIDKSGHQQKQTTLYNNQTSSSCAGGYPIDTILKSCPYLISLKLHKGRILANAHRNHFYYSQLKSIRMDHVEIYETNDLFTYLSTTCPDLAHVFLRRCISDSFDIDLSNLKLGQVVLSELKRYPDQQLDHLTLFQQHKSASSKTDIRLYKSSLNQHTFRPFIRRLKKIQKPHIYLQCQSVDQLIFNGCKI